jgi:site-specific recombinase XerC
MTEAVDDFLRYAKAERGLSAHTVAAYRRDLGEFVGFLQGYLAAPDWSWETIDRTAIRSFLGSLQKRGLQRTTIARKLSALVS